MWISRTSARRLVKRLSVTVALGLVAAGCAGTSPLGQGAGGPKYSRSVPGIERATSATPAGSEHFSDPYPLETSSTANVSFSGTFKEIITCAGGIKPGCFTATPITVDIDPSIQAEAKQRGVELSSTKAHHITRTSDGRWQMVLSSAVIPHGGSRDDHWNIILHAHPTGQTTDAPPKSWIADAILVGSLDHNAPANYDGKYFEDGGNLYLVYSKSISTEPTRFGIAAQLLTDPAHVAPTAPVMLLSPSANPGLASENYFSLDEKRDFRLVETGNVVKLDGKYVMLYSVGSYQRPTYKVGVAYSDTFLPASGRSYRKVMLPDPTGIWGSPGAQEVGYLLQSQEADWPNYAGKTVQAPGVGSIIRQGDRSYLFFAGYDKSEKPHGDDGTFDASHRRPYYVPIKIDIPADTTVTQATDSQLASWITLQS